jgi:hypothetical protein
MKRSDDYGRRRWPDQRYGGSEQGYGHVPGDDRNWRERDLSGGRYGNTRDRNPYDASDNGWNAPDDNVRDDGAWRRGRTAWGTESGRQGNQARGGPVYYPARSTYDENRDESTPHNRGYVTAYSSGYEDGYQAASRSPGTTPARRADPNPPYEPYQPQPQPQPQRGYEAEAGRNYRQRSRGDQSFGQERSPYGYSRRVGPKNYTRTDERIREELCERLAHQSGLDVSEVDVTVMGSIVTLTGSVDNRRIKYEVEDIADDTFGVTDVINKLHIRPYGVLASE